MHRLKPPKEILSKPWQRKEYGKYGLSIEIPTVMVTGKSIPVSSSLQASLESWEMEVDSAEGLMITIGTVKANSSIQKVSLDGAAEGALNPIKRANGVTDFEYKREDVIKNNIHGIITRGTFKTNGINSGFTYAIYAVGRICWSVNILNYSADDEVGKEVTKRIIESIQINYTDSLFVYKLNRFR